MYTRLVLKPIETYQDRKSLAKAAKEEGKALDLSIQDVNDDLLCDISKDAQSEEKTKYDVADTLSLSMHLNYVMEVLLSLTSEQIGYFFLMYDCQPLSENLIQRSLTILFKYAQIDLSRTLALMQSLNNKLKMDS